jgi:hypothetical protein
MNVTHPHALPPLPYTQLRALRQSAAVDVFSGLDSTGAPITVAVLTSAGAADPTVRAAFVELASSSAYAAVAGQVAVHASDLACQRPWAANWQFPGQTGVEEWATILPGPTGGFVPSGGSVAFAAGPAVEPWQVKTSQGPVVARKGRRLWVPVLAVSLVVVVIAGAIVAAIISNRSGHGTGGTGNRSADPVASQSSQPAASPSGSGQASPPALPGGSEKPTLRQATQRIVAGPSYAQGDSTYLMAFKGWPFAFRTPASWGCLAGKVDNMPDAVGWVCVDEQNAEAKQKLTVMLRPCPTTCTASERSDMSMKWFDGATNVKSVVDDRTWAVEVDDVANDEYSIDLSRFIPATPGETTKWQVAVLTKSPRGTKATVQKIVNDIVTQTP